MVYSGRRKGALLAKAVPCRQVPSNVRCLSVVNANVSLLSPKVKAYIEENATLCQPDSVYICDGSDVENAQLLGMLEKMNVMKPLAHYDNW